MNILWSFAFMMLIVSCKGLPGIQFLFFVMWVSSYIYMNRGVKK